MSNQTDKKKRILVLSAHLDDEVLGVGGTMARNVAEGNDVFIHIIRDGIAERHFDEKAQKGNKREFVKDCAIKSAAVLGVPKNNVSFGFIFQYTNWYKKIKNFIKENKKKIEIEKS